MRKFRVSAAAFLLGLIPVLASAQSGVPDPAVPGSGYRIPSVVQTQHSGCGEEVAKLRDNVLLRLHRPGNGNDSLGQQNSYLQAAGQAAAAGDNARCAYWRDRYNNVR
jgi:hypothetical protein